MINLFKVIVWNAFIPYKNFINWTISKIFINISSFLLWLLFSLPFILLLIICVNIDSVSWITISRSVMSSNTIWLDVISELFSNIYIVIIEFFIFILALLWFVFWYSYKNLLISNLYLNYIEWNILSYSQNLYFNFKKIFEYFKVFNFVWLFLLIPVIIFLIGFWVLIYMFWGIEKAFYLVNQSEINYFSVILWIWFFINLFLFIYLAYRMSFSYIILMDEKKYFQNYNAFFYIKESFNITKDKIFYLIISAIILVLFVWIFGYLGQLLFWEFFYKYLDFIILPLILLWLLVVNLIFNIKLFKFLFYIVLFSIFMLPFNYFVWYFEETSKLYSYLYTILLFFIIWWLFEMIIVSIYKNIMLENKEDIVL